MTVQATVSVGLILVATVFHLGHIELAVYFAFTSVFTILVTPFIVGPALESALNVLVIAGMCVIAYSVSLILRSSRERAADALFQVKTVLAHQEQTVADRTAELHDRLREREVPLRELHHRAKNSLQMLAGLVHLSISAGSTKEPQHVLMTTDFRVSCLSFLYNNVYALPNVGSVTLDQYLTDLTAFFQRSVVKSKPDAITIAVGNNTADVDKAIGLGVILCETFLVASEYATDDNATTKIAVSSDGGKFDVNLTGTGASPKTLDTLLVEGLVEQYEGTGSIAFDEDGTLDCCFSIPAYMI